MTLIIFHNIIYVYEIYQVNTTKPKQKTLIDYDNLFHTILALERAGLVPKCRLIIELTRTSKIELGSLAQAIVMILIMCESESERERKGQETVAEYMICRENGYLRAACLLAPLAP